MAAGVTPLWQVEYTVAGRFHRGSSQEEAVSEGLL